VHSCLLISYNKQIWPYLFVVNFVQGLRI